MPKTIGLIKYCWFTNAQKIGQIKCCRLFNTQGKVFGYHSNGNSFLKFLVLLRVVQAQHAVRLSKFDETGGMQSDKINSRFCSYS